MNLNVQTSLSWISGGQWSCIMGLLNAYFNSTIDVFSEVKEIEILFQDGKWPLYIIQDWKAPQRDVAVDALFIRWVLQPMLNLEARYRKVLVITKDIESSLHLWTHHRLLNVLVMKPDWDVVTAYTWFPYKDGKCGISPELEVVDTCKTYKGNWSKNLYPKKVTNDFGGCPVFYKTHHSPPDCMENSPGVFTGREVTLMNTLGESVNMKVIYRPTTHDFYWEDGIYGQTAIAMLRRGEIDFAFASMVSFVWYLNYSDPLPAFRDNPLVWMLPKPWPQDATSAVYNGFSPEMWLAVLVVVMTSWMAAELMSIVEKKNFIWLDLVKASVATAMTLSSSKKLTAFLIIFQIYSMHIAWFYQSMLLGNLVTIPMKKQYKTPEEAINAGLPLLTYQYMQRYINGSGDKINELIYTGNNSDFDDIPYERIVDDRTGFTLAWLVSDGYAMRVYFDRSLKNMVHTVTLLNNPVSVWGVRNSPITKKFAELMLLAVESGIFWHITDRDRFYYDLPVKDSGTEAKVLKVEQLEGVFFLYGITMSLALTFFIAELICGCIERKVKKRKSSKKGKSEKGLPIRRQRW